jgi:hypothetical protein
LSFGEAYLWADLLLALTFGADPHNVDVIHLYR